MEVDLTELLNSYEVVPVSLSDPFKSLVVDPSTMAFKSLVVDPSTMVVLRVIPIIGFIALLMAAVWIQSKKIPAKAFSKLNETNKLEADNDVDLTMLGIEESRDFE